MTESALAGATPSRHLFDEQPAGRWDSVDVLGQGRGALVRPTAIRPGASDDEIDYLPRLHRASAATRPTSS